MLTTRREFLKTAAAAGIMAGGTLLLGGCGSSDSGSRTTLFSNGTIYLDPVTKASNLLVQNGRVIGYNVNPADWSGAELVNLGGACAYPGFNGSHVHLITTAVACSIMANSGTETDPVKIAEIVGAKCKQVPPGTPVMAHGFVLKDYDNDWTLDNLATLDQATGPDHPVMMADQLGHSLLNSDSAITLLHLQQTAQQQA